MAKRVDPLKAKEAKQKKLAIVLGVLLIAVGAFQGPKTLKMLKGEQAVAPTTTTTPQPAATPATTPATGAPATPTGTPDPAAGQPAVLADTDLPPLVDDGQLASFELFRSKDPFAQQVGEDDAAQPSEEPSSGGGETGGGSTNPGEIVVEAPEPPRGVVPGGAPAAPTAPSAPEAPAPEAASTTSISVNGKAEDVELDATFPALEPTFVLVSLARNGKSVQIAIAGGSYADGSDTIKLELGKPLTLQNMADGTRYVLVLKTVKGFVPPKGS